MSPKVLSTASKLRLEQEKEKTIHPRIALKSKKYGHGNEGTSSKKEGLLSNGAKGVKRKRHPFRIKTGCVVALRHLSTGNDIKLVKQLEDGGSIVSPVDFDDFVHVWTSPVAGRDEGLALIGKRIRCFFPKNQDSKRRVLEGEIIGLLDTGRGETSRRGQPFHVELLIDKNHLEHFTFLKRTDDEIDLPSLSGKEKKFAQLEEQIRGRNKATVQVALENLFIYSNARLTRGESGVKWAIQKLVPVKLFHKPASRRRSLVVQQDSTFESEENGTISPSSVVASRAQSPNVAHVNGDSKGKDTSKNGTSLQPPKKKRKASLSSTGVVTRLMGDGNDSPDQQMANWRWLASRYHDMLLQSSQGSLDPAGAEFLSIGLVGQVLKVESVPGKESTTLAMVTLRRLFLPQHTVTGNLSQHRLHCVFEDHDTSAVQIQVPIEQLIIVSRKLRRDSAADNEDDVSEGLVLSHRYSLLNNLYLPIGGDKADAAEGNASTPPLSTEVVDACMHCHRCGRQVVAKARECSSDDCPLVRPGSDSSIRWCIPCLKALRRVTKSARKKSGNDSGLPCCLGVCDCRSCVSAVGSQLQEDLISSFGDAMENMSAAPASHPLRFAASVVRSASPVDFGLPCDLLDINLLPKPLEGPSTRIRTRTAKIAKRAYTFKSARPAPKKGSEKKYGKAVEDEEKSSSAEDYNVFKPSCAKLLAYDPLRKSRNASSEIFPSTGGEMPRNMRDSTLLGGGETEKDEKTSISRAARANQRRLVKAFGASSLGLDALATREPQLRFDRSGIHAWGVFADEDISAGQMIVEYRGELIENAMAEKREKEYEAAKIGSDYMFRIDSMIVCDATKQGNVARFINASCDPNCYTKIIITDGSKRIVIYAKRDILAGEELCYDYKFPLEYDETKRIPCHCGARDCRGFMNWDKRYVSASESPDSKGTSSDHRPLKIASEG